MKNHTPSIILLTILQLISPLTGAIEKQTEKNKNTATSSRIIIPRSSDNFESDKPKKYEPIDGSTSASQLRAKKSHSVSKEDETGLAIFFGIIVLSVIIFFLKPFSEKK